MESRPRISPITSITAHIIIQMVHILFHRSHPSTLEYLRNKQTDNERPQSTIKGITAKSNSRQDLGNKIRYLKSLVRICFESQIKTWVALNSINYFPNQKLLVPKFLALESLSVQIMSFPANLNLSNYNTF